MVSLLARTIVASGDVKHHGRKEEASTTSGLRSCVKVEVATLGSPSPISLMVFVDVKHHERRRLTSELRSCVNREVDLGSYSISDSSPVPNKPYVFVDVIKKHHKKDEEDASTMKRRLF